MKQVPRGVQGVLVVGSTGRVCLIGRGVSNVDVMDNRNEIRQFLTTRRARISPERAGLPDYGGHRRVPGLRRGEVAMLAGFSPQYYTRLEQGKLGGVSESILHAVARALQLDDAEQSHLFDLARTAGSTPLPRRRTKAQIPAGLQYALDAITGAPAFVRNGRLDILSINSLGRALFSEMFRDQGRPVNMARFVFLDPRAADFYPDWDAAAHDTVALLRAESGRDPFNKELSDLVGELSTRSEQFGSRWPRKTCAATPPGSSTSTTRSLEPSNSCSTHSNSRPTLDFPSTSMVSSPDLPARTPLSCSAAGRPLWTMQGKHSLRKVVLTRSGYH
jgi:transcriptional regulator with XRE-family HTH domain